MPHQVSHDDLQPSLGRDALRRAAVFATVWLVVVAAGTAIIMRTHAPAAEEYVASARLEQPEAETVDPNALRKALVQPDRIEAAVQALPRTSGYERQAWAAAMPSRLNVAMSEREGMPACRVTLSSMPGLAPRRAVAILDHVLQKYVDDLHQARVARAQKREAERADLVAAADQKLKHAQQEMDECLERLARIPVVNLSPAAANTPAAVAEVPANLPSNGERSNLEQQLAALRSRREILLERRTPAHPDVIDVDDRIASIERRLAAIEIPVRSKPIPAPRPAPEANVAANILLEEREKLLLAQAQCRRAEQELATAQQDERLAHDGVVKARAERREVLVPAVVPPTPSPEPRAPWLLAIVASGTLLAWGASLCVRPATIDSPAELARVLQVPVVGVLPADLLQPARHLVA